MTVQVDHMHNLKAVYELFRTLTTNDSFGAIQKSLEENESLRQDLERQRVEQNDEQTVFTRNISRIQRKLDAETAKANEQTIQIGTLEDIKNTLTNELDAEKTKVSERDAKLVENEKTNSDLQEQLLAARAEIDTLKNTVQEQDARHKDVSSQLENTSQELGQKKAALAIVEQELGSLRQLSRPMKTESQEEVSNSLQEVFNTVHGLATTFFSDNLQKAVLDNNALWDELRQRITWLPLPATNSREAKQMRIAACIGALGSMLAGLIFVPVYVEPDSGEITRLLSQLAFYDEKREIHLRSVLLAAMSHEQEMIREKRAIIIVETIYNIFGRLLHDDRKDLFKAKVQDACRVAVKSWEFVRHAEIKVDTLYPPFDPTEETASEFTYRNWVPIRLTPPGTPPEKSSEQNGSPKSKGSPKTNGAGRKTERGGGREDSPPPTNGVQIDELQFGHSDIQRPLWPAFGIGDQELAKGYVLLNSQSTPARQEMGNRRMQRQSMRNSSMSRPPSSAFLVNLRS